jgi:ribosomal protein S18 acetylase RimI-like enzyme
MISGVEKKLRPAVFTDQRAIANLMHFSQQVHRHLDWRNPLDWIGSSPYYILEDQEGLLAALGCPPDPPKVAWIRLFVNSGKISAQESWQILWEKARKELMGKGEIVVAAIVLQEWSEDLFRGNEFSSHQSIVMLEREGRTLARSDLQTNVTIRAMMPYDLPAVAEVDAAAFDLLWQNSLPALKFAYPQAVIATVAEEYQKIIGYQLSTRNPYGIHLARLAVQPSVQGKGVGYSLVADLIQQADRRGLTRLTVNTQSDNSNSLALYQHLGFKETGERYPVYQYQLL